MRGLPDKAFDLACVDPPYGPANAEISGGGEKTTLQQIRPALRPIQEVPPDLRNYRGRFARYAQSAGQGERGRASTQKNHWLGRGTQRGIFQGTVSCLEAPNHLGSQLLSVDAPYTVLYRMAKAHDFGTVHDGNGRVRMDIVQQQCQSVRVRSARKAERPPIPSHAEARRTLHMDVQPFRTAGMENTRHPHGQPVKPHSRLRAGL